MTSGDLTAVTGASAKTGPSVTPSQVPAFAQMGIRDGAARSPVSTATTARGVSYPASVSTGPLATTRPGSVSARRGTPEPCEYGAAR